MRASLRIGSLQTLILLHTSLQQIIKAQVFLPQDYTHSQVSALVNCDFLYPPVCFFSCVSNTLPFDLCSLMDLKTVVGFSVCSTFSCCWHQVMTSRLLTCQIRDWRFPGSVLIVWFFIITGYIFMLLLSQLESLGGGVHLICFLSLWYHQVFTILKRLIHISAKFSSHVWRKGNSEPCHSFMAISVLTLSVVKTNMHARFSRLITKRI